MLSCVVVGALALVWPSELPEDEPEEPAHEAANITIAPRIVTTSVIRFMSFYTFLYEGRHLLVHKSRSASNVEVRLRCSHRSSLITSKSNAAVHENKSEPWPAPVSGSKYS